MLDSNAVITEEFQVWACPIFFHHSGSKYSVELDRIHADFRTKQCVVVMPASIRSGPIACSAFLLADKNHSRTDAPMQPDNCFGHAKY